MKKLFDLILLLSACFSLKVNASHLMGGQITASRIDTFKYAIDLTLYRDTDGIPIATIDVLNYYEDSMGTWNYDTVKNIYADAGAYFINGTEVYHYYDKSTFLKAKTVKVMNQDGESSTTVIEYADYKSVNGVLMPHKTILNVGPMTLNISLDATEVNGAVDLKDFE